MGMFPDPEIAQQQQFIIDLLKKGHAVIRAMAGGDKQKVENATIDLLKSLEGLDMKDPAVSGPMAALILSYGILVPPSSYGEDITKWEEFDGE